MQSLEELISNWRAAMRKNLDAESAEELEQHLRDAVAGQMKAGKSMEDAFQIAAKELGGGEAIRSEFNKVESADWWAMKVSFVFTMLVVLGAIFAAVRFSGRQYGEWLGPHVAAVTIGFLSTYIAGALGMAFVLQRFFSGFTVGRMESAARAATNYSAVAAVFTAAGTILGMIWAKHAWGRYWDWDAKETGAFGLLVWQILFFLGGKSRLLPARAVLTLAIVGNMVVSLGWFAPNRAYWILVPLLVLHAAFVAMSFAPSRSIPLASR